MAQNSRRGVARPKPGVDPFTTVNRPYWLLQMQEERRAAEQLCAQEALARMYREQSRGDCHVVVRRSSAVDGGVAFTRIEVELDHGGLF